MIEEVLMFIFRALGALSLIAAVGVLFRWGALKRGRSGRVKLDVLRRPLVSPERNLRP